MQRFFFSGRIEKGTIILLPEEEALHIRKVLRLRPGAEIELFDGEGGIARAQITSIAHKVSVKILDFTTVARETESRLQVGQGILKGKKMDLVVQKCTELGVSTFIPVLADRCQAGNVIGQKKKKHQRWQRIIESSCGQCRRNHLMNLYEPKHFNELVVETEPPVKLLFWEEEKDFHLSDLPEMTGGRDVMILLGPEGGFSKEEVQVAQSHGYQSISLGSRILRAETATIASVAILQNMLGNMG